MVLERFSTMGMVTTALIIPTAGYFIASIMDANTRRRVRKLPHFVEALKLLADNDDARLALGNNGQIEVKKPNLKDYRHNYINTDRSMLRIPLVATGGQNALLDVYAVCTNGKECKTSRVQLRLANQSIIIFDDGKTPEDVTIDDDDDNIDDH